MNVNFWKLRIQKFSRGSEFSFSQKYFYVRNRCIQLNASWLAIEWLYVIDWDTSLVIQVNDNAQELDVVIETVSAQFAVFSSEITSHTKYMDYILLDFQSDAISDIGETAETLRNEIFNFLGLRVSVTTSSRRRLQVSLSPVFKVNV